MAQRVDRQVQLGTLLQLGTVIARPFNAFGSGTQSAAVQDRSAGLGFTARRQTQDAAKILGQRLEAACRQPTLRLLVDCGPRRQVIRHPVPRRTGLDNVAEAIEHLAQRVFPLPNLFRLQRQIGRDQRPFLIGYIRRVRRAGTHVPQSDRYRPAGP